MNRYMNMSSEEIFSVVEKAFNNLSENDQCELSTLYDAYRLKTATPDLNLIDATYQYIKARGYNDKLDREGFEEILGL